MDIREYDRKLIAHDWYYSYSDDINVWRHGSDFEAKLQAVAKDSPAHQRLWDAYVKHRRQDAKDSAELRQQSMNVLNAVRVSTGATTQDELDELEYERQEQLRYEEERKREKLEQYNWLCYSHNWFYWKERTNSPEYQLGLEVRTKLTQGLSSYSSREEVLQDPNHAFYATTKLFTAYAAHYRGEAGSFERLKAVRQEFDLPDDYLVR